MTTDELWIQLNDAYNTLWIVNDIFYFKKKFYEPKNNKIWIEAGGHLCSALAYAVIDGIISHLFTLSDTWKNTPNSPRNVNSMKIILEEIKNHISEFPNIDINDLNNDIGINTNDGDINTVRNYRHKYIAHKDLNHVLQVGGDIIISDDVIKRVIDIYIKMIRKYMEKIGNTTCNLHGEVGAHLSPNIE